MNLRQDAESVLRKLKSSFYVSEGGRRTEFYEWASWRAFYTLASPYLRPHRMLEVRLGRFRLPDFLIIGAERGGTTSLYVYMTSEPNIVAALRKEIDFFDQKYQKGWTWYLAHFPMHDRNVTQTGEASPAYIFFPEAPVRVANRLPDTKIIVLLRNPIDRAFSHYQHELRLGYESLSFQNALRREIITDNEGTWKLRDLREKGIFQYVHFSYLAKGLYVNQLKRWMMGFPRERFLIVRSERFFNDPGRVLSEVLDFLGLPPTDRRTFPKYNEGSYRPLDEDTTSRLRRFYAPYNEELSRFLSMDFSDWQ